MCRARLLEHIGIAWTGRGRRDALEQLVRWAWRGCADVEAAVERVLANDLTNSASRSKDSEGLVDPFTAAALNEMDVENADAFAAHRAAMQAAEMDEKTAAWRRGLKRKLAAKFRTAKRMY